MRYLLLVLSLLLFFSTFAQESPEYQEYSYSELFQMIEDEQDSIFTLSYAKIKFNELTDERFLVGLNTNSPQSDSRDTIFIQKTLDFQNLEFVADPQAMLPIGFTQVKFMKPVTFTNCSDFYIANSYFHEGLSILNPTTFEHPKSLGGSFQDWPKFVAIIESTIKNNFYYFDQNGQIDGLSFSNNEVVNAYTNIIIEASKFIEISNNKVIESDFLLNTILVNEPIEQLAFTQNNFASSITSLQLDVSKVLSMSMIENIFASNLWLNTGELSASSSTIGWNQFTNKLIDVNSFNAQTLEFRNHFDLDFFSQSELYQAPYSTYYNDTLRIQNEYVYNSEIAFREKFYRYYKNRRETSASNQIYIEIKKLETKRFEFLYQNDPSFDNYLSWKINEFLDLFSSFGTRPAKSIIFSTYVIIAFALIYLFFPNHWDSHGKDRILHRYQFFFKYLNKDAGMHDVFLDGKKDELAHYDGFKNFFIENGKHVPKFFLATALPLYRWSTASTRTSSWFLSKIDIFRGKWSELPAPQRAAKTILLTIAFLMALLYDIFIKMLNALMLSINTFTTLGFGEIPIKGLPRYLAIVQGFIGWFMLTIFSVSLISQLLN